MLDEEISQCITVTKPAVQSCFYTDTEILRISDRLNYGTAFVSSCTQARLQKIWEICCTVDVPVYHQEFWPGT